MIKQLFKYSRGIRKKLLFVSLLGIVAVISSMVFIVLTKRIIDIATKNTSGNMLRIACLLVAFLLLQQLLQIISRWYSSRNFITFRNHLQYQVYESVMCSRWNEPEKFKSGDVMTRLTEDVNEIAQFLIYKIPQTLILLSELLMGFALFYYLNPLLAVIVASLTPIMLFLSRYYIFLMRRLNKSIREKESLINGLLQENYLKRNLINAYLVVDKILADLLHQQISLSKKYNVRTNKNLVSQLILQLCFAGGYLTAFLWGTYQIRMGAITFGTLTAFLQLANKVQSPMFDMIRIFPGYIHTSTAIDRVNEIKLLPQEDYAKMKILKNDLTLSVEHVCFSYPNKRKILDDLNMKFAPNSMNAIVGSTGVGKTTLVRLLLGFVKPNTGRISLDMDSFQEPITAGTRINFIYVPQTNSLFGTTIRENLRLGNFDATEEEMHEALHTAMADFVFTLPEGLNTTLGEQGMGLSEGQAQRIAIARALLKPGHILLLDEATSALDPETEKSLLEKLRDCVKGKTFIFITHHPSVVSYCDQVYQIKEPPTKND